MHAYLFSKFTQHFIKDLQWRLSDKFKTFRHFYKKKAQFIYNFRILLSSFFNPEWEQKCKLLQSYLTQNYDYSKNENIFCIYVPLYTNTIIHYVVRFGGTPFISIKISVQALNFEFDLPIPNGFCHNFMNSWSSSIVSIICTE